MVPIFAVLHNILSPLSVFIMIGEISSTGSEGIQITFVQPNGCFDFQDEYVRNSKGGGQKNFRCFPQCNLPHNNHGFCGSSIIVEISNYNSSLNLFVFGSFRSTATITEPKDVTKSSILATVNTGALLVLRFIS